MAKIAKKMSVEKGRPPKEKRRKSMSGDQCRDTGMALVLMCLLVILAQPLRWITVAAIVLLVLTMLRPQLLSPLARIWFGATNLLGKGVSSVILTLMFFLVVTPVGLIRRAMGADAMRKKQWRRDSSSVFVVKEHIYTAADLEQPF